MLALNANDSDGDLQDDRDQSPWEAAAPDPDLALLAPLGTYCCPCPRHGWTDHPGAELVSDSPRVKLWWDGGKQDAYSGSIMQYQSVRVEGLEPSPYPWADKLIWHWTETTYDYSYEHHEIWQRSYYATNRVTILGVALMPDADGDGEVASALPDAPDNALLALSTNRLWLVGTASNTLRKVLLSASVGFGVPGSLKLSASGYARLRVWPGPSVTNGPPLLVVGFPGGNAYTYTFPDRFAEREVYAEFLAPGDAKLCFEFDGTQTDHRFRAGAEQKIRVWELNVHSVELDDDGFPVVENGRAVPAVGQIGPDEALCTYVPYGGGGAPDIESTSPRWVTFTAVTNSITNCATLSMTQDEADGFKVWDLDFGGATSNGTFAWLWQGASNRFLRAEVPANAAGTMMPLALAFLDTDFNGLTNAVTESFPLYRHEETNGFWGSTYSITGPRENIGMPAFSARNAFVVRVPPDAGFPEGTELVCRLLPGDDEENAVEVEMERRPDGSYTTCLVVPVLDIDGDTGLESVTNAVKLKFKGSSDNPAWTGWEWVRITIARELDISMRAIASKAIPSRRAALFSALVTNEENGNARADYSVKLAGEYARSHLGYGVTPLFSPDKQQINDMLRRHRVWVHSGHGHHKDGISILKKTEDTYSHATFKASDIAKSGLDYDLVFMNTCESTDVKYIPVLPATGQAFGGWDGPHAYTNGHAVLDIGNKLNAKNYVGWDCEVVRQLSVTIPTMLMQELDSTGTGETRTVEVAVEAVWNKLRIPPKRDFWWYGERLNGVRTDGTVFDLNKKPF
jgi:hypothetical protein